MHGNTDLLSAARDVIDRWETPLWKDASHTADVIYKLRDVLNNLEIASVWHEGSGKFYQAILVREITESDALGPEL